MEFKTNPPPELFPGSWKKKKKKLSVDVYMLVHVNFLPASPLKAEHITHPFAIFRSGKL